MQARGLLNYRLNQNIAGRKLSTAYL